MNEPTKDFVRQWVMKAREDLIVVETLTRNKIVAPSSACFHCQQAVEKILKAFLIANGLEVRRTHNLEYLLSLCSDIDEEFRRIDPLELSDFGVEARYPGDMFVPEDDEVIVYKNLSLEIFRFVEEKLTDLLEN